MTEGQHSIQPFSQCVTNEDSLELGSFSTDGPSESDTPAPRRFPRSFVEVASCHGVDVKVSVADGCDKVTEHRKLVDAIPPKLGNT